MGTDALFPDGSVATFNDGGGSFHDGGMAMDRLRLITARSALQTYIKWEGRMQLTRDGHRAAVLNVIEPLSGKQFSTRTGKVTMKSCREALAECEAMLAAIEASAVVLETDS